MNPQEHYDVAYDDESSVKYDMKKNRRDSKINWRSYDKQNPSDPKYCKGYSFLQAHPNILPKSDFKETWQYSIVKVATLEPSKLDKRKQKKNAEQKRKTNASKLDFR